MNVRMVLRGGIVDKRERRLPDCAYIIKDAVSAQALDVVKIVWRACSDHVIARPVNIVRHTSVETLVLNPQLCELYRKGTSRCASSVDQDRLFILVGIRTRPPKIQDVIKPISGRSNTAPYSGCSFKGDIVRNMHLKVAFHGNIAGERPVLRVRIVSCPDISIYPTLLRTVWTIPPWANPATRSPLRKRLAASRPTSSTTPA